MNTCGHTWPWQVAELVVAEPAPAPAPPSNAEPLPLQSHCLPVQSITAQLSDHKLEHLPRTAEGESQRFDPWDYQRCISKRIISKMVFVNGGIEEAVKNIIASQAS